MRQALDGNGAVAHGTRLCRPQVIAAYPITPQTPIVEEIASFIAKGQLDARYIAVESEHSALSAIIGAALVGCRVFTATAGAGLALMHEIVGVASGNRLPMVMAISNRSLPSPWSLQVDHSDSMAERDMGWIQLYSASAQESLDLVMLGFRLSEEMRLPVMVCQDGFYVSHATSVVDVPTQDDVDAFLGPFQRGDVYLDPQTPMTINQLTSADTFTELKYGQKLAMDDALSTLPALCKGFEESFARSYGLLTAVNCEHADVILVALGSCAGTSIDVAESLSGRGLKVGVVKVTCYRPFPHEELRQILGQAKCVAVIDRSWALGSDGPLASDVKAALYPLADRPPVYDFVAGIGGRDLHAGTIKKIIEKAQEFLKNGTVQTSPEWADLREE